MPSFRPRPGFWGVMLVLLCCVACAEAGARPPTATPDYPALETAVAAKLGATLTAKAPPTATPTQTLTPLPPTATPRPSATVSPTPSLGDGSLLAYVRVGQDQAANIVLKNLVTGEEDILTHFPEPLSITGLRWSRDGQWLIFVSAHDFIHSRNNERNVFIMRPDGTALRMITGDYVDPSTVAGPFATLKGQVLEAQGTCHVCAQGTANPVQTDPQGHFELAGVPLGARWIRAVCSRDGVIYQGDRDLPDLRLTTQPITLTVEAKGQGWIQAAPSPKGDLVVGTFYTWTLRDGKKEYTMHGLLSDLQGKLRGELELPPKTNLIGLDWSPVADEIVGGLTGEKQTWLWRWNGQGASLGPLLEMANPQKEMLSAMYPVWSPDGRWIAFGLRHWDWWEGDRYRTELVLVSAQGKELRALCPPRGGWMPTMPPGRRMAAACSTSSPPRPQRRNL